MSTQWSPATLRRAKVLGAARRLASAGKPVTARDLKRAVNAHRWREGFEAAIEDAVRVGLLVPIVLPRRPGPRTVEFVMPDSGASSHAAGPCT